MHADPVFLDDLGQLQVLVDQLVDGHGYLFAFVLLVDFLGDVFEDEQEVGGLDEALVVRVEEPALARYPW